MIAFRQLPPPNLTGRKTRFFIVSSFSSLATFLSGFKAVGVAYPLASKIVGDATAAFGDENDKFGGLGRNGAQQMEVGEVIKGNLLAQGGDYSFQAGKFFNLEGSPFIKGHGDVTGKEIAHAVRNAIAG